MAEHYLDASVTQPYWDNSIDPRLEINPGDTVVFDCPEPCGQVTPEWGNEEIEKLDSSLIHAIIGSVYIKGALPGDTLEIEVLELKHRGWGWSAHLKDFGLLADDFNSFYIHHWKLEGDNCYFGSNDIVLPYRPFCGVMGVAPAEPGRIDTHPPRQNGGNVDIKDLGPGTKLWLPVFVDGALFACGDCHSAQGDGELCGTGIESPMEVKLRFNIRKDLNITELQFETMPPAFPRDEKGSFVTTAHGPDLMENSKNAARYMIDWLVENHALSRSEAYILCSQAVDLKISEIVDEPNFIVSAYIPLNIFKA